jgi:hypothetical protein
MPLSALQLQELASQVVGQVPVAQHVTMNGLSPSSPQLPLPPSQQVFVTEMDPRKASVSSSDEKQDVVTNGSLRYSPGHSGGEAGGDLVRVATWLHVGTADKQVSDLQARFFSALKQQLLTSCGKAPH